MADRVQPVRVLQREAPERRIVGERHERAVEAGPLEERPDEGGGSGKRRRLDEPVPAQPP